MHHMDKPLEGRHVLVLRAAHQNAAQCERLAQLGAQGVALPALAIEPVTEINTEDYWSLKDSIQNIDTYQIVIFVSPNAAEFAYEWIDSYWPQLPVGVDWIGIGQQTCKRLQSLDIPAWSVANGYDSESLLSDARLQNVAGQRVLILRGQDGRRLIYDTLTQRGAKVDYRTVYYRRCPRYSEQVIYEAVVAHPPAAILATSGEVLTNLLSIVGQLSTEQRQSIFLSLLIVPSQRIAELARGLGFTRVRVASGPDDESMVQAIIPANELEQPA